MFYHRKVKGTLVPFWGSGGTPQITLHPLLLLIGEGGKGDEVSLFSYFMVLVATPA